MARRVFAEVPLRVEYSLTPLGWTITEPLIALSEWDEAHAALVTEARSRYASGNSTESVDSGERLNRSAAA